MTQRCWAKMGPSIVLMFQKGIVIKHIKFSTTIRCHCPSSQNQSYKMPGHLTMKCHYMIIWRIPKMGVPPVIIHFCWGFSTFSTIQLLGYIYDGEKPWLGVSICLRKSQLSYAFPIVFPMVFPFSIVTLWLFNMAMENGP